MKNSFKYFGFLLFILNCNWAFTQVKWISVDSLYGALPKNFHVYKTTDSLDGKPFIAYYVKANLKNKQLNFTSDTSYKRRLSPKQFFEKDNHPLLIVNCSFFNFDKNQNLNLIIKNGKILAYNVHTIALKGKDTFQYKHPLASAIGINKKRQTDVAWIITDSLKRFAYASEIAATGVLKDSSSYISFKNLRFNDSLNDNKNALLHFKKWKVKTAVGGGPVLVQDGKINITNEQEAKFVGKAINDKHPRTCMGYTKNGELIIMVIQGRFLGIADGATLEQEAKLLIDLGCVKALNLDGGGSSCLLINGKETIKPSDKEGERPVPAVFIIEQAKK